MADKKRLDLLLKELNLVESREKAQAIIMAGEVLVNDQPVTKPGHAVRTDANIRLRSNPDPYVSRAAKKLIGALDIFSIPIEDKICLDVGVSTGGFTQVLLERGAKQVIGVDVGYGQIDWRIRNHPKLKLLERTNARYLTREIIPERPSLVTIDVSFISQTLLYPALIEVVDPDSDWVCLIKPQFEVGPERIGKGGIVRELKDREWAIERVKKVAEELGWMTVGVVESSIKGTDGNQEYLAHLRRRKP